MGIACLTINFFSLAILDQLYQLILLSFLYVMTAPVTIIPLVLFAIALNHTSLIVTGLAQYIEPSLQFLL